ncbi:MAG: hypothetical protein EZS28_040181 [Streblomastix strix]|uniref:Uncharacterized protein n=1 Tax=Streblomastix strix TaxID=222440 RepID=A0A5J4U2Q2_9EUKA|nr:MAG: hypothetical protein EZS28_040181 [Streblomastix strix]
MRIQLLIILIGLKKHPCYNAPEEHKLAEDVQNNENKGNKQESNSNKKQNNAKKESQGIQYDTSPLISYQYYSYHSKTNKHIRDVRRKMTQIPALKAYQYVDDSKKEEVKKWAQANLPDEWKAENENAMQNLKKQGQNKNEITGMVSYGCVQDFDFGYRAELGDDGVFYAAQPSQAVIEYTATPAASISPVAYSATVESSNENQFWDYYYGNTISFSATTDQQPYSNQKNQQSGNVVNVTYSAEPSQINNPNKGGQKKKPIQSNKVDPVQSTSYIAVVDPSSSSSSSYSAQQDQSLTFQATPDQNIMPYSSSYNTLPPPAYQYPSNYGQNQPY